MRVAFLGTPEAAVPSLRAVIDSAHEVAVVITQPDRPRGRSGRPSPSAIKQVALEGGVPVLQPDTPKREGFADELRAFDPDALAVVAYGHILPAAVLEVAPAMNVHFSLLPAYRGAAPVQRALMDGVRETGVSVFLLEPTVDTGPVVAVERIPVADDDTAGDVLERLAPIGARLLVGSLDRLAAGSLEPQPQDDAGASPAPKLRPEEAVLGWSEPAKKLADLVRALNPRPGAHTTFRSKRLLVWRARRVGAEGEPGRLVSVEDVPVVATGDGGLALTEVQPEGKRRMSGEEFVRGYRPAVGDLLAGEG